MTSRLVACVLGVALSMANASRADDADAKATQKRAFDLAQDAKKLAQKKEYDQACTKFEESLRLYDHVNTIISLAQCEAARDRTATALSHYEHASARAGSAASKKQIEFAIRELQPRLTRLRLVVTPSAKKLRPMVELDGKVVGAERLGSEMIVNPEKHSLKVTTEWGAEYHSLADEVPSKSSVVWTIPGLPFGEADMAKFDRATELGRDGQCHHLAKARRIYAELPNAKWLTDSVSAMTTALANCQQKMRPTLETAYRDGVGSIAIDKVLAKRAQRAWSCESALESPLMNTVKPGSDTAPTDRFYLLAACHEAEESDDRALALYRSARKAAQAIDDSVRAEIAGEAIARMTRASASGRVLDISGSDAGVPIADDPIAAGACACDRRGVSESASLPWPMLFGLLVARRRKQNSLE